MSATHALYRFYATDGTLLYVGITADPGARWRKHAQDKPWWTEVRGISMETYPSRAEVLAAETRAIAVENPKHNKQRPALPSKGATRTAAHPPRQLVWLCAECQRPIADGKGYLHVDMRTVHEVEKFWEDRDRAELLNQATLYTDLSDIREWPDPAPWLARHRACDPDPEAYDYWLDVKRARTHAHLLNWSAHLMEKSWLRHTNWSDLIQRQAGVDA